MKTFNTIVVISVTLLLFSSCDRQEVRPIQRNQGTGSISGSTPTPTLQLDANRHMTIGSLHVKVPSIWTPVQPSSSMRRAQFVLNDPSGKGANGELSAFYFGPDAGGIEPNLVRWYNQFEQSDGSSTGDKAVREELVVAGMKVILVHFSGIMKASTMPGAPQTAAQGNYMNLSAIVVTPEGPWFFKGTGPEATMKNHMESMKEFVQSLHLTHS